MPTSVSSPLGPLVGFFFGLARVQQNHLTDLVADGVHRVQAGHGVLKDDGDLALPRIRRISFHSHR